MSTATTASPPSPDAFMDWAERTYPIWFSSHVNSQTTSTLTYRHYPATGNYLGVSGSDVYVYGAISGNQLVKVGTLSDFAALVSPPYDVRMASSDVEAARFLLQAQFSASEADIAALRQTSYAAWLNNQFNANASTTGFDWLDAHGYNLIDSKRYYDNYYPGDYMIWNQLITSPDAVRKRMALALSEFFVVSLTGLNIPWRSHAIAGWWDILVSNAFGNYRKLLEDVTLNPAMGYFLATKGNQKENTKTGRAPDENYAREVMQLFSIGLHQLNPDGTEKRDASGQKIETYTQNDITNLARVFTGWDFDQTQNVPTVDPTQNRTISNTIFARLPMRFTATNHSLLEATFLGVTIPANTDGITALKIALDTLFNHPNGGAFFGKQMIQRLVTSNPSPAYVARVAAAFNDNGGGVRGDLRAVWRAILLDDEARNPAGLSSPNFGKLREPMLRLVQWARTFNATSPQDTWKINDLSDPGTKLGQSPLRSPSVFNFFRPGYVPPGTALSANQIPAPEFQLVSESSVGGYLNFMQNVIYSGISSDVTAPYTTEMAIVHDANALVQRLNLLLCAGQLSAATITLMVTALNATAVTTASSNTVKRNRIAAAIFLVMASSEYLVQK